MTENSTESWLANAFEFSIRQIFTTSSISTLNELTLVDFNFAVLSSKSGLALTFVSIDQILTSTSVFANDFVGFAFVDVYLAVLSSESWLTFTFVSIDQILTFPSISANDFVGFAFVDI